MLRNVNVTIKKIGGKLYSMTDSPNAYVFDSESLERFPVETMDVAFDNPKLKGFFYYFIIFFCLCVCVLCRGGGCFFFSFFFVVGLFNYHFFIMKKKEFVSFAWTP